MLRSVERTEEPLFLIKLFFLTHGADSHIFSNICKGFFTTLIDNQHVGIETLIMESVELKLREINNSKFVTVHTKHIIDILDEPKLAIEVKTGQISEDVTELVESLGYQITANRPMDGWNRITAVKEN